MGDIDTPTRRSVAAVMTYLSDESSFVRRFDAPEGSVDTGLYDTYAVRVQDAREGDPFSLDTHGFALQDAPHPAGDTRDVARFEEASVDDALDLVRRALGADEVVALDSSWCVAAADGAPLSGMAPEAVQVGVDPSDAARIAREHYLRHIGPDARYRRHAIVGVLRVFSAPPQSRPVALVDARTVRDGEGVPDVRCVVSELPSDPFGPVRSTGHVTCGTRFHYRPDHRWYYYPGLGRDEALLFVEHDSDRARPWRVLHSSFLDASVDACEQCRCLEVRVLAYFG